MKKTVQTSLVALATLAACTSAYAQITLHLDTGSKEYWFTGTDTVTPQLVSTPPDNYQVIWKAGTVAGSYVNDFLTGSEIIVTGNTLGSDSRLETFTAGDFVQVRLQFTSGGMATLNGGGYGQRLDYSFLGTGAATLEGYINGSLPVSIGSSLGPINVVPEPHEHALMAGLGLIGFAGFRRWRQRA